MTRQGYHWCDHCEQLASGPRCEHCSAVAPTVRWIHVSLHHNPFRTAGGGPQPVSVERGRELWQKLHATLDGKAPF